MTYAEAQAAEAAYQAATTPGAQSARKPRGASKATLAKRAAALRCCYCGDLFTNHTLAQTLACANARS